MTTPFMGLPQFTTPNALIDFRGLNAGIDSLGRGLKDARKSEAVRNAMMQAGELGLPAAITELAATNPDQAAGLVAQMYNAKQGRDQSASDRAAQRESAERQFAESRRMHDSSLALQRQQMERSGALLPYEIDLKKAQAAQAQQKDQMNAVMADILKRSFSGPTGGPQVAPPAGMLPQSNDAVPMQAQPMQAPVSPESDPMLVRTQATATPQSDPALINAQSDPALINAQSANQPTPTQPDLVRTPLGPMPMAQAQQLGFALGLAGKGDAGKIFLDAANANKLSKEATNKNDKDQVGLVGTLARIQGIRRSFEGNKAFLEIPTRVGMQWNALRDKFGALPAKEQERLGQYARFRQRSVNNAALYVKELSGVAVSEAEFKRIMLTLPNAGTGIGDGDSPAEFVAKMREVEVQSKMAIARSNYLRANNFSGKAWEAGVEIDDIPRVMRERQAQLEQEFRRQTPNLAPDQMKLRLKGALRKEFGI